jgi:hypothetical protein
MRADAGGIDRRLGPGATPFAPGAPLRLKARLPEGALKIIAPGLEGPHGLAIP